MDSIGSIAWRVMCRRRNWCGPQEVLCDSDSDNEIVCDCHKEMAVIYDKAAGIDKTDEIACDDDRVFKCDCGHEEHGQDADDCRYLCTVHHDCGCTDCDYEECEACEDAECYQKDVCANCETKYDKEEEERLEELREEEDEDCDE